MSAGILRPSDTAAAGSNTSASSGGRLTSGVAEEPNSPAPSVDRLSVTFAMDEPERQEDQSVKVEDLPVQTDQISNKNDKREINTDLAAEVEEYFGPEVS